MRALLAYVLSQPSRTFRRDDLATLLWPDGDRAAIRHNLRQALYNIRSATAAASSPGDLLLVDNGSVRADPASDLWIDVRAFELALGQSGAARGPESPEQLERAAQLYRGDFLAGLSLRDSAEFEEWLRGEQERLREAAIHVLHSVVRGCRRRGDMATAVQHALRLTAIDPLSEEAHRELMRLYALSGRRARVAAQYEPLRELLDSELGVEPAHETKELYESLLQSTETAALAVRQPLFPAIPLVGREAEISTLLEHWRAVSVGRPKLTIVEGDQGIGKTRLVKSVLDAMTGNEEVTVLIGHAESPGPLRCYGPFAEIVAQAGNGRPTTGGPAVHPLAELAGRGTGGGSERVTVEDIAGRLTATLAGQASGRHLVLLLDDLHLADPSSFVLLQHLLDRRFPSRIWVVATAVPGTDTDSALAGLTSAIPAAGRLALGPLSDDAVASVAMALSDARNATSLAAFLVERSAGSPGLVTEWIHHLRSVGTLSPSETGTWTLRESALGQAELPRDADALGALRFRQLPTTARRLLTLAAASGQRFEESVLRIAADEQREVVEASLYLMLRRWLVRRSLRRWSRQRRQHDLHMWAEGARTGQFEFTSKRVRKAVYDSLPAGRSQAVHGQVARVLLQTGSSPQNAEDLAYHLARGPQPEQARPWVERCLRVCRALGADETAARFTSQL